MTLDFAVLYSPVTNPPPSPLRNKRGGEGLGPSSWWGPLPEQVRVRFTSTAALEDNSSLFFFPFLNVWYCSCSTSLYNLVYIMVSEPKTMTNNIRCLFSLATPCHASVQKKKKKKSTRLQRRTPYPWSPNR